MSIEANKALVRRYYDEVRDQGNTNVVDEIFAERVVGRGEDMSSLEAIKQVIQNWHAGFSDNHTDIVDQIAEGDIVATHWKATATHTGEFRGVAATGQKIEASGSTFHRVQDGKIVEHWGNNDMYLVSQQLGLE